MARRPLCIVCLLLMLSIYAADYAGFPLIRGNPVSKETASWIEKHPKSVICGEVVQTTENEFSQSIYLKDTYLVYKSRKISIENVKVFLKTKEELLPGTVVQLSGKLQRVESERNPGEFDSRQYYACQHIYYFLNKAEILKKSENYSRYQQFLVNLRKKFGEILEKTAQEEAGVLEAIVLGDKKNLDETLKLRYQMAGIMHILAISGLHISVIGAGLYKLLMKTGIGIWPSGMLALFVMLQYGIMTGGSVSTMRAVCMFLLLCGAKITGRIYDMPTALSVSAMMILGESGAYLYSSGFLLSFCAVLGIGVAFPVLKETFERSEKRGKIRNKLKEAILASLSVQLTMLPVSLYFFGEISLVGIFLNLVILPTVGIILESGVFAMLAGCVSIQAAKVVVYPGRILGRFYEMLCRAAGNLPGAVWIGGQPRLWQLAVYYVILTGALLLLKKRKGRILFLLLMISAVFLLTWKKKEDFSITCLDVGQGDCLVLETGTGNCFLVDGGSTNKSKTGQYQILPYLKSQGIGKVDGILISHTDEDHISGIREILELTIERVNPVKISCLYLPNWKNPPDSWKKLRELAQKAGIPVKTLQAGKCIAAGKLKMDILWPQENASGTDVNEEGIVVKVSYGNFTGLLTGDMGEETEKRLLQQGKLQDIDFLKVGHHGSHYSSCQEFLKKIKPEWGVISCSSTNTYGHPSKEAIERLEKAGCQVYYTMKGGAITVYTDGNKIRVREYLTAG